MIINVTAPPPDPQLDYWNILPEITPFRFFFIFSTLRTERKTTTSHMPRGGLQFVYVQAAAGVS